jgi:hypothetical protein
MFAVTVAPKTFNNCLGLERGLWQHQTRYFADVPKRSVFGVRTFTVYSGKIRLKVPATKQSLNSKRLAENRS